MSTRSRRRPSGSSTSTARAGSYPDPDARDAAAHGTHEGVHVKQNTRGTATVHLTPEFLELRVPSRDAQGHVASQRWQVEVPPYLDGEVRRFVNDPQHEYFGNLGAYVRKAALLLLEVERQLDPPKGATNHEVIVNMALTNTQSETRRMYLQSIERTADEVVQLIAIGNEEAAVELVHQQVGNLRKLPAANRWRKIGIDAIKRRFGHLLKQGEIVSLLERADDDGD